MASDLYFMLNPALGIIKIGIAGDVQARRVTLECACGVPLDVVRVVRGAERFERDLHLAFDATRLCGEWFSPTEELVELAYGKEAIPAFLARKQSQIEATVAAKQAANEAERTARMEATRERREEIARLKAAQKRAADEREARRKARAEQQAQAKRDAITAAQAEWMSNDKNALRKKVLSQPRVLEARGRQRFIESQRSRNAVLNGVAPATDHA